MERKVRFVEGEFYHIYNRGVDKRIIFSTDADHRRFMMLLYLANSTEDVRIANLVQYHTYKEILTINRGSTLVAVGAFCLMPNHFHLLLTPLVEDGISKFMLKLQTGYSMYFNTKYDRTGALFQGPFKSEHAKDDVYLKYLFSYIHLNPAKLKDKDWKQKSKKNSGLLDFVQQYPYSSFKEYIQTEHIISSPDFFPEYFPNKGEIISHITDWLT